MANPNTYDPAFMEGMTHESGVTDPALNKLRCVVVTPEKAVLDESADFVVLPMADGELGVLPQHAPLIGRLGRGELRITRDSNVRKLRIEGGFAQVRGDVVTVLTARVLAS